MQVDRHISPVMGKTCISTLAQLASAFARAGRLRVHHFISCFVRNGAGLGRRQPHLARSRSDRVGISFFRSTTVLHGGAAAEQAGRYPPIDGDGMATNNPLIFRLHPPTINRPFKGAGRP